MKATVHLIREHFHVMTERGDSMDFDSDRDLAYKVAAVINNHPRVKTIPGKEPHSA